MRSIAFGRNTFTPWTRCARAFISVGRCAEQCPLFEYKTEESDMLGELMENIKNAVLNNLIRCSSNRQPSEIFPPPCPPFVPAEEGLSATKTAAVARIRQPVGAMA